MTIDWSAIYMIGGGIITYISLVTLIGLGLWFVIRDLWVVTIAIIFLALSGCLVVGHGKIFK